MCVVDRQVDTLDTIQRIMSSSAKVRSKVPSTNFRSLGFSQIRMSKADKVYPQEVETTNLHVLGTRTSCSRLNHWRRGVCLRIWRGVSVKNHFLRVVVSRVLEPGTRAGIVE